MKIKIYIHNELTEEYEEEGFPLFFGTKDMSILNLFDGWRKFSYKEKEYLFPNGGCCRIKISTDPLLQEVFDIMKEFEGLILIEVCDGNAKLQIEC